MIYLLLSILCSSLIFIIFKWLGKLEMNTLLVIVLNYFFAAATGAILSGPSYIDYMMNVEWLKWALLLGSGFVGMFYAMARATHLAGAAPSVVANKMSVIIPISVAFIFLGDSVSILKIVGIVLALFGIFFATRKEEKKSIWNKNFMLLMIIFLGSGLIDTSIKLIENFYLSEEDSIAFTSVLFLAAFIGGILIFSVKLRSHLNSFYWNKLWMGLALGLVNFGSIYFLVMALKSDGMESSVLFPLNNIGVVVLSTLMSVLFFREEVSRSNVFGLILSVMALMVLMTA